MSEEFKKINKAIASFMLTSLAISGSALAQVNENLIADAMGTLTPQANTGMVRLLYGVPTKPQVNPNTPTRVLYGVPTDPQIVNPSTPTMALYGVPTNTPTISPSTPTMALYGVPTKTSADAEKINQQIYNSQIKDTEAGLSNLNKTSRDEDSKVPVNYIAPIIIPGYYIPDSK